MCRKVIYSQWLHYISPETLKNVTWLCIWTYNWIIVSWIRYSFFFLSLSFCFNKHKKQIHDCVCFICGHSSITTITACKTDLNIHLSPHPFVYNPSLFMQRFSFVIQVDILLSLLFLWWLLLLLLLLVMVGYYISI